MANYYRRFILNYSRLVAPMLALTKTNTIWEWSAFDEIKKKINNPSHHEITKPHWHNPSPSLQMLVVKQSVQFSRKTIQIH
jgi:hypothetical protein